MHALTTTSKTFYVYMLHEAPEQEPFWCKVSYSDNPLKRLNELQAGNPRYLRCWEYTRRPTNQFGLPLPDKAHARAWKAGFTSGLKEWDFEPFVTTTMRRTPRPRESGLQGSIQANFLCS